MPSPQYHFTPSQSQTQQSMDSDGDNEIEEKHLEETPEPPSQQHSVISILSQTPSVQTASSQASSIASSISTASSSTRPISQSITISTQKNKKKQEETKYKQQLSSLSQQSFVKRKKKQRKPQPRIRKHIDSPMLLHNSFGSSTQCLSSYDKRKNQLWCPPFLIQPRDQPTPKQRTRTNKKIKFNEPLVQSTLSPPEKSSKSPQLKPSLKLLSPSKSSKSNDDNNINTNTNMKESNVPTNNNNHIVQQQQQQQVRGVMDIDSKFTIDIQTRPNITTNVRAPRGAGRVKDYRTSPFTTLSGESIVIKSATRIGDYIQSFADFGFEHSLIFRKEWEIINDFGFNLRQSGKDYRCSTIEQLKQIIIDVSDDDKKLIYDTKKMVVLLGAVIKAYFNTVTTREEGFRTVFFCWEKTRFCCHPKTCQLTDQ